MSLDLLEKTVCSGLAGVKGRVDLRVISHLLNQRETHGDITPRLSYTGTPGPRLLIFWSWWQIL